MKKNAAKITKAITVGKNLRIIIFGFPKNVYYCPQNEGISCFMSQIC